MMDHYRNKLELDHVLSRFVFVMIVVILVVVLVTLTVLRDMSSQLAMVIAGQKRCEISSHNIWLHLEAQQKKQKYEKGKK